MSTPNRFNGLDPVSKAYARTAVFVGDTMFQRNELAAAEEYAKDFPFDDEFERDRDQAASLTEPCSANNCGDVATGENERGEPVCEKHGGKAE